MATEQNFSQFRLGEDWQITIQCCDSSGAALDLTGGDLKVRLADFDRTTLYLDLSKAGGVSITNAVQGIGVALITAAMQRDAALTAQTFRYDALAVLADGTESDQAFGTLTAAPSLFSAFP